MIVNLLEHSLDVDTRLVKGPNGANTRECTAELFKDWRFGVGFEAFDFSCSGHEEAGNVDAYRHEGYRHGNHPWGNEGTIVR